MDTKIQKLQKIINIKFKDLNLLKKAITHKSFDPKNNFEKLEFLGDRILGFVISIKLISLYPDEKEGILEDGASPNPKDLELSPAQRDARRMEK